MRTPRQQALVACALLVALGVLLRVPSLTLPLGAHDAALAAAGEDLAGLHALALQGDGPLVPALVALPVAVGADAPTALRLLGLLAGAVAPALVLALGLRLGLLPLQAGLSGLLLALHPLWIAHAGGAEVGAWGLGVALLLVAWQTRRQGGAWCLLAVLAQPGLWPQALVLGLATWASGGPAGRLQGALAALGGVAGAAWMLLGAGPQPVDALGAGAGLLLAAGLLLVVRLPHGARMLAAARGTAPSPRAALVAGVLQAGVVCAGLAGVAVSATWDGLAGFAVVTAGFALLIGAGVRFLSGGGDRRLAVGGLVLLLPVTLLSALGPAQHALLGERAPLAGRLHALAAAARLAAREAGPEGWVALDLGDVTAAQARALAPLLAGRPLLVTPASGGSAEPPSGWPPGGPITLSLLTVRPEPGRVTTLGGWGIYAQEPAGRVGAFHVQRIRRP